MRFRRSAAVALVLAAGAGLSGCQVLFSAVGSDDMAIQQVDGDFRLSLCRDFELEGFDVSRGNDLGGRDWFTFWRGDVDASLAADDVLGPADISFEDSSAYTAPDLRDGDGVAVLIQGTIDGEFEQLTAHWTVEDAGRLQTEWLHPDGRWTSTPCEAAA